MRPPTSYTEPIKRQEIAAYGLNLPPSAVELDHLISLELGGAPRDVANLWPEPWLTVNEWGAHRKDVLEGRLHMLVCDGKVSLADAQRAISTDWTEAYRIYIGQGVP